MPPVEADLLIHRATAEDVGAIIAVDHLARNETARRAIITHAVGDGHCYLAKRAMTPLGYVILEYTFFANGFVPLLYVSETHRHEGVGHALMRRAEEACVTPKLFTSTNASNTAMRNLLLRLGYQHSGVIENLDEGDPELVFLKRLRRD